MNQADDPQSRVRPRFISLIVPCFNEEANIRDTLDSVRQALETSEEAFEVIAVNDGSSDRTIEVIRELSAADSRIRAVDLMRNFGQTIAYQTGLDLAQGSHIVLFSGDLEIPADQILRVIEMLDAGQDFVNTARKNRWGGSHALKSRLANRILNRISGLDITDRGSGLKGMRREVADSLQLYGEWHRFIPDLASICTDRITEFEVPFAERKGGTSSYRGKLKSLSVFLDLATVAFTLLSRRKPYSLLPGRFFGFTGIVVATCGSFISLYLVILKLFFGEPLSNRPLFMVSILMAILGIVMIMVGVLGELVMQISTTLERKLATRIRRNDGPNLRNTD